MAAPTVVTTLNPLSIKVTGTNIDAGDNDYTVSSNQVDLSQGFSIITGTITAVDVKVFAANDDGNLVPITEDLFGTGTTILASNLAYVADINLPVKKIVVRVTQTNATNAVNISIFARR